tara:strand:- start:138 stop:479 length:342 start_codon:yes stop_codon:yes gene_type:complete
MRFRTPLFIYIIYFALAGCGLYKEPYELQGKVRDLGDAMAHCRGFIKYTLHPEAYIYIDSRSSRETAEHYDIFLHLQDNDQEGFAQCRVNKQGLITYHSIREFRQKGRAFADD